MDRQDAKPSRPSLLADNSPRSAAAPSASRILADMENRTPAASGVRKPRGRRKRGAGLWVALGLAGLALVGAGLWLTQDGDSDGTGTTLSGASPTSLPAPTEALPVPASDADQAKLLSAPSSEVIAGTADADPPANAQAKIVENEDDNPFAVIDKSAAAPAAPAPAAAKAPPPADPFAVVAKATPPAPAPTPAPARVDDANPFAAAPTPRAATPPAAKPAPAAQPKPKPVAAAPKPAAKPDTGAQVAAKASEATAPAPAGTDLLTQLNQNIHSANQGGALPASIEPGKDKAPAGKPLQRKTSGTDAEVLDDLVKQVNSNRETVETISGGASAAGELLNRKN